MLPALYQVVGAEAIIVINYQMFVGDMASLSFSAAITRS